MKSSIRAALVTSTALVACTEPAFAQVGQDNTTVEEIVVTGSRIVRKDYLADSPIVTVQQEALEAVGPTTLENVLNQLPQFAATNGSASQLQASGGRSNANLRGLGKSRTLVLLDGRRLQPSDPLGAVDLNTIAGGLIESVEVITGGASAVYGSDAIAGVVNFRMKRNFSGLEADAQYGRTERGDGDTFDLSLTMGGNFAEGRGNAVLNFSYLERDEILRGRRPFFKDGGIASVLASGAIVADATNLASQAVVNNVFAQYGVAPGVALNSRTFGVNPDGTLFTTSSPVVNLRFPADGPYVVVNNQVGMPVFFSYPLQQPMNRYSAMGRVRYDVTEAIEAYGQFNFTQYGSQQNRFGRGQDNVTPLYIPVTNPFLSADLRTISASRARPNDPLLIYFNQGRFAPDVYKQDYTVYQLLGGLTGKLEAIDGSWDVYASYGKTRQDETRSGMADRTAYLNLVNAADGGRSICDGGLNPLSLDRPSAACLNYLMREQHENSIFSQAIAEGTVQGRLKTLPAGDARFAAGVSYRRNEYEFNPDSQRVANQLLGIARTSATAGETSVSEVFVEVLAPILADLPFVKRFDVDLAYRYSDYDGIGGVQTYKASGNWAINDQISIRGGYQRAIRAPAVGELYQPAEQGSTSIGRTAAGNGDPCDVTSVYRKGANAAQVRGLCLATGVPGAVVDTLRFNGTSVSAATAGNLDLKPEVSDTYTAGVVWRSRLSHPLLSKLSASLDYYSISLEDAIGVITGPVIMSRCFNGEAGSNPNYDASNYYCQLIQRDVSGSLSTLQTPSLNLGGFKTEGVDVQLDWAADLSAFGWDDRLGSISLNTVVSYVSDYAIQTLPGAPFVNYAGTIGDSQISRENISHPEWRVSASLGYKVGPASFDLRARWVQSMDNSLNVGAASPTAAGVESVTYFDLAGRYDLTQDVQVRGGVLNLADKQPPEWTGQGATDTALFDALGRRFYVGVNVKF